MKKMTFLFIAFTFIGTSCSNEDAPIETSGDILGTWIANSVDYGGQTVSEAFGEAITTTFVGEAYDIDLTVTFNESPKTYVSEGGYSVHLTSTVLGQTYTQDVENLGFPQDGSWQQNGNKLIMEIEGEEIEAIIEKLTADELIITYETIEDVSQQVVTITSTVIARVTFSRGNN